jgi:hypothetical protein
VHLNKSLRFGLAAFFGIALTHPAAAQGQPGGSLEDRVKTLEQRLGVTPPANATLEERVQAIEARLTQSPSAVAPNPPALTQQVEDNGKKIDAQQTRLSVVEQKVADTTVTGRMYLDVSNISQTSDGAGQAKNGWGFDAKRFYITIDHRFNETFSGDVTTDFNYVSADSETQLFIKKAYLQATIDPALIIRAGSNDLPWIPFNEGLYGYRYLENVLEEREGFGSSADWGLHAFGSIEGGLFSYQVSVINGGGYKKLVRSKSPTVEARVNVNYMGFTVAVGDTNGTLGQDVEGGPHVYHTANRFESIISYTGMGIRAGVQYMQASNWFNITTPTSDSSSGYSVWGSYNFTPQWAVFGRYDWAEPSRDLHAALRDQYFNVGVTYSPIRIVDISLAYKHENVDNGSWATSNGTIGGLVNAVGHKGTYDEAGIWADFQW